MVNPFLSSKNYDTETAIMLERANVLDIGNAVAYTDGDRIFLNTQDNLFKILPAYDDGMLKWLLWHERMHLELRHHNRYFKYVEELTEKEIQDEFHVTKEEVNIIMDILVHDSMSKMFPELIETALNNLAQMRDRNSLKYTFKTNTLEEMLDEYAKFKHKDNEGGGTPSDDTSSDSDGKSKDSDDKSSEDSKKEPKDSDDKSDSKEKSHEEGGHDEHGSKDKAEDGEPEIKEDATKPKSEQSGHHDETDWSKLDDIDSKEFISTSEGNKYMEEINKLKRIKIKLAQITSTLNGLITTNKTRTYKTPSYMQTGQHTIFKGRQNNKSALYLCFDASGSMGGQMQLFKEIISKAIPQALKTPTKWFSGYGAKIKEDKGHSDYYTGTFQDFMSVLADSGYSDDGDRTIELCYKAEQEGYSPIGVTDGGGCISWSKDYIKQLKRTVLVGQNASWLKEVQRMNPNIQIIIID